MIKKRYGFTLIEILVVMAIVAIVGTFLVTTFANTLRGSNKAQMLAAIKQNGQTVLDNMVKAIREADKVVCVTSSGNTLVLIKNGVYVRYRFIQGISNENGQIKQDNPVQPPLPDSKNETRLFINSLCTDDTDPLGEDAVILTDTNTQSGISVIQAKNDLGYNQLIFKRNSTAGTRDSIKVQFVLKPGAGVALGVASQIDPVVFQTTVQLR